MLPQKPQELDENELNATYEAIFELIARGCSLVDAAQSAGIDYYAFAKKCRSNELLSQKLSEAREIRAELLIDELSKLEEGLLAGTIAPPAYNAVVGGRKWAVSKVLDKKQQSDQKQENDDEADILSELSSRIKQMKGE